MKRTLAFLAIIPAIASATPFDLLINQRNIADSATLQRQVKSSGIGTTNIFMTDQFTGLPVLNRLGNSFLVNMATNPWTLESGSDWTAVTNKPIFATVATSGDYNDLINKPASGQVNSDWSATSGVEQILNKPLLSTVATTGAYSDLSGLPSIPAAQVSSDWSAASGISQVLNKPTTLAGYGISDAYPLTGNPSGFLTSISSGQVSTALGFTPYSAANPSGFVSQSGARSAISLTTTGSSGSATYNASTGVLNVPSYAAPARSQASATRALNSAFQISATRDAFVSYSVQTTVTASIGGGQDGDVFLDIASDSGFTANVQSLAVAPCSQTYTLAIALQGVQKCAANLAGYVPAGYYARLRTVANTGAPVFAYRLGVEVLQ